MSTIGLNISRIAKEKGIKQNHIAKISGFTERQLSDMVHGRKIIQAEHILPIADALGVTPNKLLGYADTA